MPYTPDEQKVLDHVAKRLTTISKTPATCHLPNPKTATMVYVAISIALEHELNLIKELLEDIKATRDKEYPCDQKGE